MRRTSFQRGKQEHHLSFMSAYTLFEVERALAIQGFQGRVREPEMGKYVALVTQGQ